nr:MAG TPA: hypothetical protein [Bacteriophage sp.]
MCLFHSLFSQKHSLYQQISKTEPLWYIEFYILYQTFSFIFSF